MSTSLPTFNLMDTRKSLNTDKSLNTGKVW